MTTAIATIPAPAFAIDLAKADRKQLRFLANERDKERVLELVKQGIDFTKSILTHEIALMLAGVATVAYLNKKGVMGDITSGILADAVIAVAIVKAGLVSEVGDALGKIF